MKPVLLVAAKGQEEAQRKAGAGIPIPISIPIPPPQGWRQLAATRKMWSIPFHPIQHARAYRLIHPLLILVQC